MGKQHETYIVFSCQPESKELCLNEILSTSNEIKFDRWLSPGVGIIRCSATFAEFSAMCSQRTLIYLQHIFPAEYNINWDSQEPLNDILNNLTTRMQKDETFSVQMRKASAPSAEAQRIKSAIQTHIEAKGFQLQVSRPCTVISMFCTAERIILGLSRATQNLSNWPGGMRKYAFRPETISRAEFKLLEAIEHFALQLPQHGLAVDLGAAPGGWTRILLENGMHVIAVDPASLSPTLNAHPNLTHFKGLAQNFIKNNNEPIDVLVNDMKMDVQESAKIMNLMAPYVKCGGLAIVTFKLPHSKKTAIVNKGLSLLSKNYSVLHVKQLFNNRSEITVVARKREAALRTRGFA